MACGRVCHPFPLFEFFGLYLRALGAPPLLRKAVSFFFFPLLFQAVCAVLSVRACWQGLPGHVH